MPDSSQLCQAFLQQSPACHWIVDHSLAFQLICGNPASVFGKSASQLAGQSISDALPPGPAQVWTNRFTRVLHGDILRLRERGDSTPWQITLFPLRFEDEIRYAAGTAREAAPWSTAEQELRNTVLSALKAQEFERTTVAKFLHDVVGQNLTALGLQLDLARMDLETVSPETRDRIAEVQQLLESVMEQVREYSYHLNPSDVERAGLRSALDRMIGHIRERFAGGLRVNVDPSLKIDPKIASALYQIAAEAVANAVQHSSCSAIEIAVKSTRSGPSLEVRDNGRGFDPADILGGSRGLGLLSMEHYAAQAGLDLAIASHPGTGTTVRAAAMDTD